MERQGERGDRETPPVTGTAAAGHWSLKGVLLGLFTGAVLIAGVPLGSALLLGVSLPGAAALVGAALFIEYGAGPVGVLMGLAPEYVLLAECSVALGVIVVMYAILDASLLVSCRWQARVIGFSERFSSSRLVTSYGVFALLPGVVIAGFYACTPVAWLFRWDRLTAAGLMVAGYVAAAAVTLAGTLGLRALF